MDVRNLLRHGKLTYNTLKNSWQIEGGRSNIVTSKFFIEDPSNDEPLAGEEGEGGTAPVCDRSKKLSR